MLRALVCTLLFATPVLAQNRELELGWMRNQGLTLQGVDAGDQAGTLVRGAGDVNDDGVDDLLVGAWNADVGLMGNEGEVYLVFGVDVDDGVVSGVQSLSSATTVMRGDPSQTGGLFEGEKAGFALAGVGDVNGDLIDDLAIGAPQNDRGGSEAGCVYMVFGRRTWPAVIDLGSLVLPDGVVLQGTQPNGSGELAGYSVAGPGDVNGDGYADLLLGAQGASVSGASTLEGRAYLVYGAPFASDVLDLADLQTTPGLGVVLDGAVAGNKAGNQVAGAGDVDGDGLADLLVGAKDANVVGSDSAGRAYLVFGDPALPDTLPLASLGSYGVDLNGQTGDSLGVSMSGGGDVNDDGYDDVILGASTGDPPGATDGGRSYLVYGMAEGAFPASIAMSSLGSAGVVLNGDDGLDDSGISVAAGGDLDDDGFDDLLVGAQRAEPTGSNNRGMLYLVLGSASLPSELDLGALGARGVVFHGLDSSDFAGGSCAFAGDVNADGYADLLVGARQGEPAAGGADNRGEVQLVYGCPHFLQSAGPVAENANFDFRAHGTPDVGYQVFLSLSAQPAPLGTKFGPWWMGSPLFPLWTLSFDSLGEEKLILFLPASTPSAVGLPFYIQVLQTPQGAQRDLTNLLAAVIE